MSINVIAILVSLAMMLTGAGGEGQGVETASRVATLRNVVVTYNGEALRLAPEAHLGVSTDGTGALFDFGVDLDGETLMPVQLGVDESGVTALFAQSDEAVTVTAQALEGIAAQYGELGFITEEYLPAYAGVLKVFGDSEQQAVVRDALRTAFDKAVERGEGTPDTVRIDGEDYDVTAYSYTIEGDELGALVDAMYTSAPVLNDYYNATFKLYGMLPEESGLTGIDSFAALIERTGLQMSLDVEERTSDDGDIDVTDAVLTVDMNLNPQEDAGVVEAPAQAWEPMALNMHTTRIGDFITGEVTCDYDVDERSVLSISGSSSQEPGAMDLALDFILTENDVRTTRAKLSAYKADNDEGGSGYSFSFKAVRQDEVKLDMSLYGLRDADGASENAFSCGWRTPETTLNVSFDLDVTTDAIADAVTGHEAAWVIDDLSDEALQAQTEDAGVSALMLKVAGSLGMDADKLTDDGSVVKLTDLINGENLPIDVDDIEDEEYDVTYEVGEDDGDYTYVIDGDDEEGLTIDFDGDDEPVEDDGALPFNQPVLGWLPQGWTVASTDVDTAYDWVEMLIADENGEDSAYVVFFPNPESGSVNYIVQENGKVVEGREINVTDFGEGGLSVTMQDGDIYGNIMFVSEAIDLETIGRIVANVQF